MVQKKGPKRVEVKASKTAKVKGVKRVEGQSTLADYPSIVQWWHPTKNGGKLPSDYTHASNQRIWLQCPGCPDCGKVLRSPCLIHNEAADLV